MRTRDKKHWNYKEISFLKNNWGDVSIKYLAKRLGRSINAIKCKSFRIGLRNMTDYGEYITFNQFLKLINKNSYIKYNKRLLNAGFPLKKKLIVHKKIKVVYMDDFFNWLKNNKHAIDLRYTEYGCFGIEPDWLAAKRDADKRFAQYAQQRKWTPQEDERLKSLLKEYKYGYRELSIRLKRTEGAIKRRMLDLKIKERPIQRDNHNPWTQSEIDTVKDLYLKGYKSQIIAEYVDRSAIAIAGLIERHKFFKTL